MDNERVYKMAFSKVYPLLLQKVEKKGRTKDELNTVIFWLTGYDDAGLEQALSQHVSYEAFFEQAPKMHPNAHHITGAICGYRVEEIKEPLMQKIRWLDKLVDELAKGKKMEKVLRG